MRIPVIPRIWKRLPFLGAVLFTLLMPMAYFVYPLHCRSSATDTETSGQLPGDLIVVSPRAGYTLAITINAAPQEIWPWLKQMGQGRGGFYTHEWVENLIGADIQNADSILPALQDLSLGDSIRLTPDPYLGNEPGQYITVAEIDSPRVLVFRQKLPNGGSGSWTYVLNGLSDGTTRLAFRRRSSQPSLFDRLALPGYYFMDMGMLAGIRERAERTP